MAKFWTTTELSTQTRFIFVILDLNSLEFRWEHAKTMENGVELLPNVIVWKEFLFCRCPSNKTHFLTDFSSFYAFGARELLFVSHSSFSFPCLIDFCLSFDVTSFSSFKYRDHNHFHFDECSHFRLLRWSYRSFKRRNSLNKSFSPWRCAVCVCKWIFSQWRNGNFLSRRWKLEFSLTIVWRSRDFQFSILCFPFQMRCLTKPTTSAIKQYRVAEEHTEAHTLWYIVMRHVLICGDTRRHTMVHAGTLVLTVVNRCMHTLWLWLYGSRFRLLRRYFKPSKWICCLDWSFFSRNGSIFV